MFTGSISETRRSICRSAYAQSRTARAASVASPLPQCALASAQPSSVTACSPASAYVEVCHERPSQTRSPTRPITRPSYTSANWPTPFASHRSIHLSMLSIAVSRPPASPPIQRMTSSSPTKASMSLTSSSRGGRSTSRSVSSKRHHDRPLEVDHDLVPLIEAARADRDDALSWPRVRLAFLEHLRLGADRVAREDGGGETHLAPTEVDGSLRDVGHRQSRY